MIKKNVVFITLYIFLLLISANTFFCTHYQTIRGRTYINVNLMPRTMVNCICCNDIFGSIFFITGSDTVQLIGKPNGIEISCGGKECDVLQCKPFEIGKEYELRGNYLISKYLPKTFKVVDYK